MHSLGLGLPLCQTLCQLLLGKITCQSELNKGSSFTISLPVTLANQTEVMSTDQDDQLLSYSKKTKLSILVAEDTLVNQQLIKAQMAQLDQTIELVDNGLIALSRLEKRSYDLVILDILMPVMDGETAIKKIRAADKRIANHYCVALTAASYKEKGEHLLEMGFDEFLSKPIGLNSLDNLVQRVINIKNNSLVESELSVEKKSHLTPETQETQSFSSNDLDFFKQQFGDEADSIFRKIAPTYKEQTHLNIVKLKDAIEDQDLSKIHFIAHTMKGEAKTFGFSALARICFDLEKSETLELATLISEQCISSALQVLEIIEQRLVAKL